MNLAPANSTPAPGYTAAQLARALGVSRQAVEKGSAAIPVSARDAWTFNALPLDWQQQITRRGIRRGFDSAENFLASLPVTPWKSPLPWDRVSAREQLKAAKLQKALANALALRSGAETAPGDAEQTGLADFKQEFGYAISPRHWRRLLARTIERDGGEENWQHLALYLDESAFVIAAPKSETSADEIQHRVLDEAFCQVKDRLNPTPEEREFLWRKSCEHFQELTGKLADSPNGNRERRQIKSSLVAYVFKAFPAGTFCESLASLKRRFDEKFNAWQKDGAAALKPKYEKCGATAKRLCDPCRKLMMGASVDFDKNYRQAWRQLHTSKKLCEPCRNQWTFNVRTHKSYCPKSVIEDIQADVEIAWIASRKGPKYARLQSPYVKRDWSDTGPGDYSVLDDMTPDNATYGAIDLPLVFDDTQSAKPFVGRLEALFSVDERTDYPLAFVLILGEPETLVSPQRKATYHQANQRQLLIRQHDSVGLPHKGLKLENGPWKNHLMDGEKLDKWQTVDVPMFENGLSEMGIRIRRALPGNPRSKVIERVFLSLQSRMRCHPGYLSNNERMDKREAVQDFLARVKRGQEHPGNELLSVSELSKLISAEFMAFADEPQNGERLPGVSPKEAFYNGIDGHAGYAEKHMRQFAADARFLLATHQREISVKFGQLLLNLPGGVRLPFSGPELDPYHKQKIVARINIEEPEFLACDGADGKKFTMKALVQMANTESQEQLEKMARWRATWARRGKVIADSLPHPFRATIARDSAHSEETRKYGAAYDRELAAFKTEKKASGQKLQKLQTKAARAGIELPGRVRDLDEASNALDRREHFLNRLREKEQQEPTEA